MANDGRDDFRPRFGRARNRGGVRTGSFLRQVLRQASLAGGKDIGSGVAHGSASRMRFGHGARAIHRQHVMRHFGPARRRVVIKARIVRLQTDRLRGARLHLRYIQRDGVDEERGPGRLYDAVSEEADGKAFPDRSAGDRHQFRFIVFAVVGGGIWGATQRTAARLGHQPELGAPWITIADHPVYPPWRLFEWWYAHVAYAPEIFNRAGRAWRLAGIRDRSALARPANKAGYEEADAAALAAALSYGIGRSHPFVDGNKCTSQIVAELFLALNGFALRASNAESSPFWSLPPATSRKKTLHNGSAITWKRLNADITIMN